MREATMTAPAPLVVLAVPPLPPYVVWADPPRSALPAPGEHVVDPVRSTVTLSVRRWGRWLRFTSPVAGWMRAEHSAELAVDLTVDLAELAAGTGPGLWIAAAHPEAWQGVWVLQGSAEICGVRRPLTLWLDPVERRPDGRRGSPRQASSTAGTSGSRPRWPLAGCGSISAWSPSRTRPVAAGRIGGC
jgi:hypothetical protein